MAISSSTGGDPNQSFVERRIEEKQRGKFVVEGDIDDGDYWSTIGLVEWCYKFTVSVVTFAWKPLIGCKTNYYSFMW